jgi:hypothetical protein
LAIGDAIVRGSGGRWRIATSPAGGAGMSVSWPAISPSQTAGTAGAPPESAQAPTAGSPRS